MFVCLSVCPFICPHGKTWRLPDGFSLNLMFVYFSKICPENSSLIKIWQEQRVLYIKKYSYGISPNSSRDEKRFRENFFFSSACFFLFDFSAVLLSWLWFFYPWRPSKRQKIRQKSKQLTLHSFWCLLNHGLGLFRQNKKLFDWYFFPIFCVIFYIPN